METTAAKESVKEAILRRIDNARTELEELRVQLALGKTGALDKFDELKRKLDRHLEEAREKIGENRAAATENWQVLKDRLGDLREKLAERKEAGRLGFDEQKTKIERALHDLIAALRNVPASEFTTKLKDEAEKFRVKLEILRVRVHLGKLEAGQVFEKGKSALSGSFSELRTRLGEKKEEVSGKWDTLGDEMEQAYLHVRKAFGRG